VGAHVLAPMCVARGAGGGGAAGAAGPRACVASSRQWRCTAGPWLPVQPGALPLCAALLLDTTARPGALPLRAALLLDTTARPGALPLRAALLLETSTHSSAQQGWRHDMPRSAALPRMSGAQGYGGHYDLILTAESIYSTSSQRRLLECVKQVCLILRKEKKRLRKQ